MAVKRTGQLSLVEALMPAVRHGQLDRLSELVKWYRFEKLVGHFRDESSPGRHTHRREAALKARGQKPRLERRPNKHHPELPPRLKRYNRLIARRRAAVETAFATWKRRMGFSEIRYIVLAKASAQVTLAAIAFNLRRWVTLSPA